MHTCFCSIILFICIVHCCVFKLKMSMYVRMPIRQCSLSFPGDWPYLRVTGCVQRTEEELWAGAGAEAATDHQAWHSLQVSFARSHEGMCVHGLVVQWEIVIKRGVSVTYEMILVSFREMKLFRNCREKSAVWNQRLVKGSCALLLCPSFIPPSITPSFPFLTSHPLPPSPPSLPSLLFLPPLPLSPSPPSSLSSFSHPPLLLPSLLPSVAKAKEHGHHATREAAGGKRRGRRETETRDTYPQRGTHTETRRSE